MSKLGTRALVGLAIALSVFGLLYFGQQGVREVMTGHAGGWILLAVGAVLVAAAVVVIVVVRRRVQRGN